MKEKLCCMVVVLLLLLSACGAEPASSFEQYVSEIERLSDSDLATVFSEKQSMDELIIGEPVSVITDDRWQDGVSQITLGGVEVTVSIWQDNDLITDVMYSFYPSDDAAAQEIIDAAKAGLGEPDQELETDSESAVTLYWRDLKAILFYFKELNVIRLKYGG